MGLEEVVAPTCTEDQVEQRPLSVPKATTAAASTSASTSASSSASTSASSSASTTPGSMVPPVVPTSVKEAMRYHTLSDDVAVICLKPIRQVSVDSKIAPPIRPVGPAKSRSKTAAAAAQTAAALAAAAAEEKALSLIKGELDRRARRGPNLRSTCALFAVAFVCIGAVATSVTVVESPTLYRVLWVATFALNVATVCIPGRLDRMYSAKGYAQAEQKASQSVHVKPWSSLFEPAPWAFAIWGLIYLLEFLLTAYVAIVGFPPKLFQRTVPYWLAGNWFQALWCFVFRPEFKRMLWVPTLCLVLSATAFGLAHHEFTHYLAQGVVTLTVEQKVLIHALKTPLALHAAWLAVAALILANSWIAVGVGRASRGLQVTASFASAFFAFLLGVGLTTYTQDPCFAATCAWGLDAVASRTQAKVEQSSSIMGFKSSKNSKGYRSDAASADVQESLFLLESGLSGALKCVALGSIVAPFVASMVLA